MDFSSAPLAQRGDCFMPNLLCFMFICNGDVIHHGGNPPPVCSVVGDAPRSWHDARQYCRSRGGTISSDLGEQANLFRSNGVTGDLWSGYFIRNSSMMQDTAFTPVPGRINISHWDYTHPMNVSGDQCVSFTNADCSKKTPDGLGLLPETSCKSGYLFKSTPCQTKLDFMCQIPARRLESLQIEGSRGFTVKENLGFDMFISSASSNMSGTETICKNLQAEARVFSTSTPADLQVLKFAAQSVQKKPQVLQHLSTSLFWISDTNRHGCYAVSLQTLALETTRTHVISWPCHAKLRVLCAYDTPVTESKTPQMVVSMNHLVTKTGQEIFVPSNIMLQTLGSDTGSESDKTARGKRSTPSHEPALRLGCHADLTSPTNRATIYRNNIPIATFSGEDSNTSKVSDHFITPRQKISESSVSDDVMDLIGSYHCSINNLQSGAVLSSESLYIRPSDVDVFPVHFELTGPPDDRLWSLFTLKSLLDLENSGDGSMMLGSQVDPLQMLTFVLNRAFVRSKGFKIKPIALVNRTFLAHAYKKIPNDGGESTVINQQRASTLMDTLRNIADNFVTNMNAHIFTITKVTVRSMDWCFTEKRWDERTNMMYTLPQWSASHTWTYPHKCFGGGESLFSVECTGNKQEGVHWGPTKINPPCSSIGLNSEAEVSSIADTSTLSLLTQREPFSTQTTSVYITEILEESTTSTQTTSVYITEILKESTTSRVTERPRNTTDQCAATTRKDTLTNRVYHLPVSSAGGVWQSPEMCPGDNGPLVTVKCKKTNENFMWGPARINPLCDYSKENLKKSKITDKLRDLSQLNIEKTNRTEIITETKKLLRNTTRKEVTEADVTLIADVLQKVTSGEKTLSVSTVKDLLDTAQLVSELSPDVLVASQSEGDSTNRILKATDSIGAALQLEKGETHKRIVSGGFGVEVWELNDQPPNSSTVVGFKSLTGGDSDNVDSDKIVTQFAGNESSSHTDTEAAIYLPKQLIESFTNRSGNVSVRLALNVYNDVRLHQFSTSGKTQKANNISRTLNSKVIAAQILVDGLQITDIKGHKVVTVFKPTNITLPKEERSSQSVCAFWDFSANGGLGDWNTTGCVYSNATDGRDLCQCDHLTNFAVLLSFYDQSELEHRKALGIISIVGLSLSITGLVLSIISFLFVKKLQKSRAQQTMFHLSIALLLSWIVFLAGIDKTSDHGSCVAVAAILHYLILASFMWMLMEGVLQYLLFVKVMNPYFSNFLWKTAVLSWGLPAVPVIITLAVDPDLYRGGEHYCWMGLQVLYYGFAIPVGLIVLTNLVIFTLVCVSLWRRKDMSKHSTQQHSQTMINIRATFICFSMLGLTWLFGFLAIGNARLVFQYLFCITSSLQGFIVFLMITARDLHIRQYWLEKVCCCLQGWLKMDSFTTPSSSSGTGDSSSARVRLISRLLRKKDKKKHVTLALTTSSSFRSESGIPRDIQELSSEGHDV